MTSNKLIARSTQLFHPAGGTITTPLLVPSFSSKGFGFDQKKQSEIADIFKVANELLEESMLVSAYDVHYGHIPHLDNSITAITIVDSGGYETSDVHDLSTIFRNPVNPEKWQEEHLKNVYDNWSPYVPAVFVSYDDANLRRPFKEQIENAREFLSRYPAQLHTILLKLETKTQNFINLDNLKANIQGLRPFHIIGLTEKELGNSTLDKMKNIADLRLSLDDVGIKAPIHIFGSLDPISSPLYFLAGAEMFDGLTWIRFGYHEGSATYIHNVGALSVGIDKRETTVKTRVFSNNVFYLVDLQNDMKKFLIDGDFNQFSYNADLFRRAYDLLKTEVRRLA